MSAPVDVTAPPWPVVGECYGHKLPDDTCRQCDGSHGHQWMAWHEAPQVGRRTSVVGGQSGPGIPVRCTDCGGRKCDAAECMERRHHRGPHLGLTDHIREVGS